MKIFTRDSNLIAVGRNALRLCMILLPLAGFQAVGAAFFQALGKPVPAILLSLPHYVPIPSGSYRKRGRISTWSLLPVIALSFLVGSAHPTISIDVIGDAALLTCALRDSFCWLDSRLLWFQTDVTTAEIFYRRRIPKGGLW